MNFKQFLHESINDKGKLKALFIVGSPGSGKSYTASNIKGTISPKIVNTDVATEFLAKKLGIVSNKDNWSLVFSDKSKKITAESLYHYVDGMLPLIIDGTSSDASNILARAGILESLGYDIGMIFIDCDIEVAKKRAIDRIKDVNREVDLEFIEQVYSKNIANKKYFSNKFKFFDVVVNNGSDLTDQVMMSAYKKAQSFFNSELENPVGIDLINDMKENKSSYMSDEIEKEIIKNKIQTWYKRK